MGSLGCLVSLEAAEPGQLPCRFRCSISLDYVLLEGSMRIFLAGLCWALAAFLVWEALQRSAERGIVTGLLALAASAAFVAGIVILRWNRQR